MPNQLKFLDFTGSQYLVQKVKSAINDVDSSLSTHIADTDIHVTTADKNRWNNQTYVFRYSSTTLTPSSTNSNALLDNTDNLKVGDKVIDSSGVLFSITAINTQNSTFTIGTALVDLAQDSDVVHKSGVETITGFKQFANIRATNSIKAINLDSTTTDLNNCYSDFAPYGENKGGNIQYYYCNTDAGTANISNLPEAKAFVLTSITTRLISNSLHVKQILINSNSKTFVRYCSNSTWSSWVNETDSEYVHKSGNETVGGEKTFTNRPIIFNPSASVQTDVPNLVFKNPLVERASTTLEGEQTILFTDKNNSNIASIQAKTYTSGISDIILTSYSEYDGVKTTGIMIRRTPTTSKLQGYSDNITDLGDTNRRWRRVYATNYYYGSNNVEFSTKFVTTDTNQTVSGQKVFTDINTISSSSEIGVSGGNNSFKVLDKNKKTISRLEGGTYSTGMAYNYWLVNNGTDVFNGVSLYQPSANLAQLRPYDSTLSVQLGASNRYFSDCYTSKINGLEPSSLSLPSGNVSDVIDISSYITALNGTSNSYTVPSNGWISIAVVGTAIAIVSSSWSDSRLRESSGNVRMLYPVLKNETLDISVIGTTLAYARFIPCQGNV